MSVAPVKELSKRKIRKNKYVAKLQEYLNEYTNVLIIEVDNVGSSQMQKVRLSLRGKAVVLMGKNTLIRKVLRDNIPKNPKLESLLPLIVGNMGFVFTNGSLPEIRKIVLENKVPAAARSGTVAPNDVYVPAGSSGLDPSQTAFFQALNIATKIAKGAIEIINDVHLLKPGDKVSASHVSLLDKLNIKPFSYGCKVTYVYEDGTVYAATIMDMSQDDLLQKFFSGVNKIAALSLAIGFPTLPSLVYNIKGAFVKLLALSLVTEINFAQAQKFKDLLSNPEALAAAQAAAAGGASAAPAAAGGKAEAKKEEKPESDDEDDMDMGDLFG